MVQSLILCNTFASNLAYAESNPLASLYSFIPGFILKKRVLGSFPQGVYTKPINDSIDFMVDKVRVSVPFDVPLLGHLPSSFLDRLQETARITATQGLSESLDAQLQGEASLQRSKDR